MKNKRINILGLGYIGLPTAALLSSRGYKVVGTDISEFVVATVNAGKIHIVEPELEGYVQAAVLGGRLKASLLPVPSDIYIICVPTPFHKGGEIPQPNIDHVYDAALSIAGFLKCGDMVILESTCPVGTTERVQQVLIEAGVDVGKISVAYCPERVLPGRIMKELIDNDRIVGGLTPMATKIAADFYRTFVDGAVIETDAKTAEMCKLTENSFRDVNIAFANELSMICHDEGIDVSKLIQLANLHPRVNILQPGTGVGGHCIAVDPWFIVARNPLKARIIRMARNVNNEKPNWVIEKIITAADAFSKNFDCSPTIACLGLSFKPDIDDLRESPALHVALTLNNKGYNVIAVEPNITDHEIISVVDISYALANADIIVTLVKHSQFMDASIQNSLSHREILDFCGVLF